MGFIVADRSGWTRGSSSGPERAQRLVDGGTASNPSDSVDVRQPSEPQMPVGTVAEVSRNPEVNERVCAGICSELMVAEVDSALSGSAWFRDGEMPDSFCSEGTCRFEDFGDGFVFARLDDADLATGLDAMLMQQRGGWSREVLYGEPELLSAEFDYRIASRAIARVGDTGVVSVTITYDYTPYTRAGCARRVEVTAYCCGPNGLGECALERRRIGACGRDMTTSVQRSGWVEAVTPHSSSTIEFVATRQRDQFECRCGFLTCHPQI